MGHEVFLNSCEFSSRFGFLLTLILRLIKASYSGILFLYNLNFFLAKAINNRYCFLCSRSPLKYSYKIGSPPTFTPVVYTTLNNSFSFIRILFIRITRRLGFQKFKNFKNHDEGRSSSSNST